MTRNELQDGIAEILLQATLPDVWDNTEVRPDPDSPKACTRWSYAVSVFLYEFAIRFKQKGLKYERAMQLAQKATLKKVNEAAIERIMSLKLPWEKADESESKELFGAVRLRADGPQYCPYCGLNADRERRKD